MFMLPSFLLPFLLASAWTQSDPETARHIARLGADFLEDREAARAALEKLGTTAEPALVAALDSPDHRVRHACLGLLATIRSRAARPRAAALFEGDEDVEVREAAFSLLLAVAADARRDLIRALENESGEYRRRAAVALAALPSPEAVGPMTALHERETSKVVKEAVFKALLSMGAAAEGFLLKCLDFPEAAERREALAVLKGVGGAKAVERVGRQFLQETDAEALRHISDFLQKAGAAAEPHFVAALRSAEAEARIHALKGLKELKSRGGVEVVAQLAVGDPQGAVREAAADHLAALGGAEAEAAFLKGMASPDKGVRILFIRKLGDMGCAKPLREIAEIFRTQQDAELRRACFHFLKQLLPASEPDLVKALADEDRLYRIEAAKALGEARSEAAIPALVEAMADLEPSMRAAAEGALAAIGPKALEVAREAAAAGRLQPRALESLVALYDQAQVEGVLDACITEQGSTGYYEGQFQGVQALGPGAASMLVKIAKDPKHVFLPSARRDRVPGWDLRMRELAVMALGTLRAPGTREALESVLAETRPGSPNDTLHEEAVVSLYRLGHPQALEDWRKAMGVRVDGILALGEGLDEVCGLLLTEGMILNRTGRRPEAETVYLRLVEFIRKHQLVASERDVIPTALYNLACLAALRGARPLALERLAEAMRAGYSDRAWIGRDRDLEALRQEPGYLELMADPDPPKAK